MVASVSALKEHLRIQHDEEDRYLESLLDQAQAAAEDFCRVTFDVEAPTPVHLAILLMAGYYYENRDMPDKQSYIGMRMAFENLLYPHRDPAQMF